MDEAYRQRLLERYAATIVRAGVNVREGQPLLIRTESVQREFTAELVRAAYREGACYVLVRYGDRLLDRIRLDETRDPGYLDFVPSHVKTTYDDILESGWCSISLRGPEDPDRMEGVDPGRLGRVKKAASMASRDFLKGVSANRIEWNVCLFPTEGWATGVLGSAEDWEERIWEVLTPILRLDREDPAQAWLDHDRELKRRAAFLNEAGFAGFRFRGPDTDLYVGMAPDRVFAGGTCVSAAGRRFFPNIPTEEVFSTPDRTRTRGTVRCTRPVEVMGSLVEGARFTFEEGRVTRFGADTNESVLERYLDIDEGARALGEVALVGVDSPIYRSGLVFRNILFDENASCHIALGNGYADCIEGGTEMTDGELEEARCNSSLVHTDFMIGSDEVSVFGVKGDGTETRIINRGEFVV